LVKPKARELADIWGGLHRKRWTPEIRYTPDNERLTWLAMRRCLEAGAPDQGGIATVLTLTDRPPVVAYLKARTLLVFRCARMVDSRQEGQVPEIEMRQMTLAPERCSLGVRSSLAYDFGTTWRRSIWTLVVEGQAPLSFATSSHAGQDPASGEEGFPRAIAAVLGWELPAAGGVQLTEAA
jgi:hypothetical protein